VLFVEGFEAEGASFRKDITSTPMARAGNSIDVPASTTVPCGKYLTTK
jgi:hypothetical protein